MTDEKYIPFVDIPKFEWTVEQRDHDMYEMILTATDEIIRYEMDLEDAAIRAKLIELGWTPPATGKSYTTTGPSFNRKETSPLRAIRAMKARAWDEGNQAAADGGPENPYREEETND